MDHNIHHTKVQHMNCYFSEICQIMYPSTKEQSTLGTPEQLNAHVTFKNEQLFIITKGGNKFYLPIDQPISAVFPLVEGIIVEFCLKTESKLQEILYYQRNKDMMEIQQPMGGNKYCYATLTRHPLNAIKMLGDVQNGVSWWKMKQKITWASCQLPLLLTYNQEIKRNAIHVVLTNMNEVQEEYKLAYVPTQSYSLKNVADSPHMELLTETIFQSTVYEEEQICEVQVTKGTKNGELYLYGLTILNNVIIYEVDLYKVKGGVTVVQRVEACSAIGTCALYPFGMFVPPPYERYQCQLDKQITAKMLQQLHECAYTLHESSIRYYHKGKQVYSEPLPEKLTNPKIDQNKIICNDKTIKIITPFIKECFVGLVAHTFNIGLIDHDQFVVFLNQYKNGQNLLTILTEMEEAKLNVIYLLHLLAEELKLYELINQEREQLGMLIGELAKRMGRLEYVDYYRRMGFTIDHSLDVQNYTPMEDVFDLFLLFNRILLNGEHSKTPIHCLYNRSNFIINFIQILVRGEVSVTTEAYPRELSQNLGKEYFYRNRYPLLSQKVFHMKYFNNVHEQLQLRTANPENKEQRAFIYLIQNNYSHSDIMSYAQSIRAIFYWLLREMRRNLPFSLYDVIPQLGFNLIQRQDLYKNIKLYNKKDSIVPFHLQKPSFDEHIKTLVHTSTSQEYFLTSNASEMNKINNDLVFDEVDRLLSSTTQIRVKHKDISHIPQHRQEEEMQGVLLKFSHRKLSVLTGEGAFNLGTSRSFITDIIKIPKINLNGVMPDDLRISLDLKDDKESLIYWPQFHSGLAAGLKLSRHVIPLSEDHLKTWIFYQKPDTPRRDHSGFLLSLGLLGYLKCFSPTDIYQYLKPNNEFTSIAILLGVSASNIAKSDESLSKTLILHIPVLLPPTVDIEIPINVQTSALIGIGLLHKGTCNRTMTEMTLSQIGKKPSAQKCLDREGYSLAAGWALGMICLGMNDTKESFRDLQLEERLIRFIEGGKLMQPPQSMISTNFVSENKCSSIKEGNNVNLHITAPAALLALSFMYLKSNCKELANKISIPNSFNTIEECNPNHVLLKTIAKNLIMWDNIKNTQEYVMSQVPELIKFIVENSLRQVHERYYLTYNVSQIDYQTITTIYASVMTGSIISMALKYAGTGDPIAVKTIIWHIQQLKQTKIIKCQFANDPLNKNCIDQYELFSLLSVSVLGLSIVMAGTCDIGCLNIVKMLRKKFQDAKVFHYGFGMAINMAIGFIFLGYGNYTFNRENMSIAALLISIFPQFPNSPTDNKWHLQALRHFYVLAMEEKIFHTVDVDTNKVISVSTEMEFLVNDKLVRETHHTPILLQESKKLVHVRIRDEDYFDSDFSFKNSNIDPKAIYIKRKHFKDIDPKMLNEENVLSSQSIKKGIISNLEQETRYKSLFTQPEPENIDLSYILGKKKTVKNSKQSDDQEKKIYFTLLKDDRLQMLEIYLNLKRQLQLFIKGKENNHNIIKNYQLMLSFEKWSGSFLFEKLTKNLKSLIQKKVLNSSQTLQYLNSPYEQRKNCLHKEMGLLGVPSSRNLVYIKQGIKKLKSRGERSQNMEFLLFSTYPECSFTLLSHLIHLY